MINRLALILVSLGIFQYAVSQKTSNNIDGVTINHAISEEVEKYISSSGYDSLSANILLYNNRLMIEFRQDDKPTISTFDAVNNKLFKSFIIGMAIH